MDSDNLISSAPNLETSLEQPQNLQTQPKKTDPFPYKVFLFICFLGFIVGMSGYWIYRLVSPQTSINKKINNIPVVSTSPTSYMVSSPSSTISKRPINSDGVVFYPYNNNIFAYNISDETNEQIIQNINEPEIISTIFPTIKVINDNTLGYTSCNIVESNYKCKIFIFDLITKNIQEIKGIDLSINPVQTAFFSNTTYAYSSEINDKWNIWLVIGPKTRSLVELEYKSFERETSIEDANRMLFSSDGVYVLQINTASPRSINDYNIYLYNIKEKLKVIIPEATQPVWLTNHTIVYRKYQSGLSGDGLYIYDVISKKNEKISSIPKNAYHPMVLPGTTKIIYDLGQEQQIWIYDITTRNNEMIVSGAIQPVWVSSTTFIATLTKPCMNINQECQTNNTGYVGIYDLTTKQKTGEIPNITSAASISTKYFP